MRGKAVYPFVGSCSNGITPAYAGKSLAVGRWANGGRDHPRLCGEKHRQQICCNHTSGSPPPMRGKGDYKKEEWNAFRITPAYAGKSLPHSPCASSSRDHPRLCGEKAEQRWKICRILGSPPPMRGKEAADGSTITARRITPAYAGKSLQVCRSLAFDRDHPRLCGEKFQSVHRWTFFIGSPPPMRGKAKAVALDKDLSRITPAYAGKSALIPAAVFLFWDHPRLCGEKHFPIKLVCPPPGSPPPMRGKV